MALIPPSKYCGICQEQTIHYYLTGCKVCTERKNKMKIKRTKCSLCYDSNLQCPSCFNKDIADPKGVEPTKWQARYLEMAAMVATWSKDPSSKFGAVIVDELDRVASIGFNGFPRGFEDTIERWNDREFKYRHVMHAEENAILNATSDTKGCTIYVTGVPCTQCMGRIKQAGITKVVALEPTEDYLSRWSVEDSMQVAIECGLEIVIIKREEK